MRKSAKVVEEEKMNSLETSLASLNTEYLNLIVEWGRVDELQCAMRFGLTLGEVALLLRLPLEKRRQLARVGISLVKFAVNLPQHLNHLGVNSRDLIFLANLEDRREQ